MKRTDKIKALKELLAGNAPLAHFKAPINYKRLTTNELYLLLALKANKRGGLTRSFSALELACIEYNRKESNKRPPSRQEARGHAHSSDSEHPYLVAGADGKVKEWYTKLGLAIPELTKCEP